MEHHDVDVRRLVFCRRFRSDHRRRGLQINLPGVGSYVARAIQVQDLAAVAWAILAMSVTILIYDQLLFRPLVAWGDRFRFEEVAAQVVPQSWVLNLFRRSRLFHRSRLIALIGKPIRVGIEHAARARLSLSPSIQTFSTRIRELRGGNFLWYATILVIVVYAFVALLRFAREALSWNDVIVAVSNGGLTLLRVAVLIALATVVWVPIGVAVSLRPKLAEKIQPRAQFLAAFPANLLFPPVVFLPVVFLIVRFGLPSKIWLSPLMILGTQWYILFNVIAGASAFPSDFREAAASFRIPGWHWWGDVMLPGIFPYFVTGAITASGGAWNASIVAEAVSWGSTKLSGGGLGAYIAQMTVAGDYPRITLGIAVMSFLVIATNRLLWRPLYAVAERRTRLD